MFCRITLPVDNYPYCLHRTLEILFTYELGLVPEKVAEPPSSVGVTTSQRPHFGHSGTLATSSGQRPSAELICRTEEVQPRFVAEVPHDQSTDTSAGGSGQSAEVAKVGLFILTFKGERRRRHLFLCIAT